VGQSHDKFKFHLESWSKICSQYPRAIWRLEISVCSIELSWEKSYGIMPRRGRLCGHLEGMGGIL